MEYEFKFPLWKNYVIGIILILMGLIFILSFFWRGVSMDNLKHLFTFPTIIVTIIYLAILWGGVSYIRKAKNNIRLKIDNKRIAYRIISKSRYEPLFTNFDLKSEWKIILFSEIIHSQINYNSFWGHNIKVELKNGKVLELKDVGGLSKKDKYKIVDIINAKCSKN